MLASLSRKLFGSHNERLLKGMHAKVARINELEAAMQSLPDTEFPGKTEEYIRRVADGEDLETLLPETFALVREASVRTLGMRHFDVQLIGGIVLHGGNIAEMKTGEGKTLVATLPAYLNALRGTGVHIVTVNDYLAQRDAEWMGQLYEFLGLRTGVIVSNMSIESRHAAYRADIIYGTNNEFGFDYLRDNMVYDKRMQVQRQLSFAIIDEVDSILIDESRTPLIISGAVDDKTDLYVRMDRVAKNLIMQKTEQGAGDYGTDEKNKQVHLTEEGHERVEKILHKEKLLEGEQSLYDPANLYLLHHINAALRARALYKKDVDYIVRDGRIVIVDEFTGRTMEGRRWSGGVHQAVEARENLPIQEENQTLATITYQNYFRLYDRLSGMTGTADTEAHEFQQIYGLGVVVIPTHESMIRDDQSDLVYLTAKDKFSAIIDDASDCQRRKQPVLVGTASIEVSEYLSELLKKTSISHKVLNAKFHAQEAQIIVDAGRPGAVTIATNMAGRGTDIVLGGNYQAELQARGELDEKAKQELLKDWQARHDLVVEVGGLRIIGTERHESRRIDNQLRGRSGRQGDPGSSRFYISLEDNLIRIFASEWAQSLLQKFGMQEGEVIESRMVSRAIERAQRKVEAHNFDIRKNLLQYDDVANDQRKVVYAQRDELLSEQDISSQIKDMSHAVFTTTLASELPSDSVEEQWNVPAIEEMLARTFGLRLDIAAWLKEQALTTQQIIDRSYEVFQEHMRQREEQLPSPLMRQFERRLMLEIMEPYWKEHLSVMEQLRQGIHLRQFASRNPVQEYKREAFNLFVQMLDQVKHDVVTILAKLPLNVLDGSKATTADPTAGPPREKVQYSHPMPHSALDVGGTAEQSSQPFVRPQRKIGRNAQCPCGSGKKFKHCHGRLR